MTRKSILSVATALTILTASCGGNKENKETADNQQKETITNVDVHGQWYLDSIVFSDSEYVRVRPDVRLSSIHQYIVFEDSTYIIAKTKRATFKNETCKTSLFSLPFFSYTFDRLNIN